MPRAYWIATVAVLGLALHTSAPAADPVTRNLQLLASRNDYPPAAGDWGYSACWGYVHPDGREYAVLGTRNGVAIYNVTDPAHVTFVRLIPGIASYWREIKSYRNWIYVVTEGFAATGPIATGMQIIRMTDPENPVLAATYATNFNRAHTVSVDTTRALLICNGTNFYDAAANTHTPTGMRVLSLANPEAPVELAAWPASGLQGSSSYYVHDCVPVGNRLYASSIYAGVQRVFDFSDPTQPLEIKNWTYPGAYYTHSCWPDAARDRLYVCDEQNGQTLRIFDISNETAPALVNQWTSNAQAIAHNARANGNDLWVANYTEGVRALDITDPTHPVEWGFADSFPGPSGGYNGVWETYPFFPSGTVIASDMNTGLYVYRPDRNYGAVYLNVSDGSAPIAGATLYVAETGDSLQTGDDGVTAYAPAPGTYSMLVRKFGYQDATAVVTVNRGTHQEIAFSLIPRPAGTFSGSVVDAQTGQPLDGAEVDLRFTPVQGLTDATGAFDAVSVPLDHYRVEVRRPGYIPLVLERELRDASQTETFRLVQALHYDPLTTGAGWSVGGGDDNAVTGVWERVEPFGTTIGAPLSAASTDHCGCGSGCTCVSFGLRATGLAANACCGGACGGGGGAAAVQSGPGCHATANERAATVEATFEPGGPELVPSRAAAVRRAGALVAAPVWAQAFQSTLVQVQPETDRSPADSLCWVTGQGTSHTQIDQADVDGPGGGPGKTTLTTPLYDMTGMVTPTIGYWAWFYSQFGSADDWLAVSVSNDAGSTWVPVDTLRGLHNRWEEHAIDVASFVTPTSQVRVRFAAADFGVNSVVEAAIDDLTSYDADVEIVDTGRGAVSDRLAFRPPAPNPARGGVALGLDVPRAGALEVDVVDLAGRRVATLHHGAAAAGALRLVWDGRDASGGSAPPGLYFARARLDREVTRTRVVEFR